MFISKPRKNKDGSISYTFRCSIKTANGFQPRVKTVRLPLDCIGKLKATKDFLDNAQREWKAELSKRTSDCVAQSGDILFIDFARQYVEDILVYHKNSYNYYNSCKAHLKTVEPILSKYLLSQITPQVTQDLCKWLCERTYEKMSITAKPALSALIDEKQLTLSSITKGCKIASSTFTFVLRGHKVSKSTAQKICDYFHIPLSKGFNVTIERVHYSLGANNGVKIFLHGVLQEAVRQRKLDRNPISKEYIRPLTGEKRNKKQILESLDEYRRFIACVSEEKDLRKKAAFALYAFTGMRNVEVVGLCWKHIDLTEKTIYVCQNTIYGGQGRGVINKECKTEKSKRLLSLPSALADILAEYKIWWEKEKINHGDLWAKTDKLFVRNNGKDMCGSTLAGWLKNFEQQHGLPPITPHGLRHSIITLQIANGVDIKTVSGRAGHSDVKITLNVYSHYTKEADRHAADKVDELLKL